MEALMTSELSLFHQALIAHELTLKYPAHDSRRLTRSLSKATVDLNPHQIDAALFAFQSPISRGAILADEVGLGKTIEAGLVISQLWAEGKRKIIIIAPASLRRQWQDELFKKFDLRTQIVDSRFSLNEAQNPFKDCFKQHIIPICSIHYAYRHFEQLSRESFDLIVVDEAHHLRNVWKKSNKIGQKILNTLKDQPKLLLTATPLHNNLMELYGLVSFIDPQLLGTKDSFRKQFLEDAQGLRLKQGKADDLKARIHSICKRTLRRQVQEYIKFTERRGELFTFEPYPDELELYEKVSEYLRREKLAAVPHRQRTLMLLVYRKILASSSFAIAGTLQKLIERLKKLLEDSYQQESQAVLLEDVDGFEEEAEELTEDKSTKVGDERFPKEFIEAELQDLKSYHALALSIKRNAKGEALLKAIGERFEFNRQHGWPEKAVVFTESRRTQQYLLELLESHGYKDQVTIFSGQNTGRIADRAYRRWQQDVPTSVQKLPQEAAIREALIHEFKNYTKVLIATEAGAEGINLQFCNTVINYDLPWNPQRIEQRIGRCHRYGQKHDVVVLNFLNSKNHADQRVYELLDQKLGLFKGIFGASDEALGALGSGVDFERRILEIYQSCRTPEEIDAAFNKLQEELAKQIQDRLAETRRKILEHFDDEVRDRLKNIKQRTDQELGQLEKKMLSLIRSCLGPWHTYLNQKDRIIEIRDFPPWLKDHLPPNVTPGIYSYGSGPLDETAPKRLHLDHPLVKAIIEAVDRRCPIDRAVPVELLYTKGQHKITILEPYLGCEGFWFCFKISFKGLEEEEHLVHFVFVHQSGQGWQLLNNDIAQKFPTLTAQPGSHVPPPIPQEIETQKRQALEEYKRVLQEEVKKRNLQYIDQEYEKLDRYVEEALLAMRQDLERIESQKHELRQQLKRTQDYQERLEIRKKLDGLEKAYYRKVNQIEKERHRLFREKEKRIRDLEQKSQPRIIGEKLVGICHWRLL
jgi:ERCC4-related helicase